MKRPTIRLDPPRPASEERAVSTRTLAAALAPGLLLALALYAGEAAAQNACRGDAHTGSTSISCTEVAGSSADILVDPGSVNIPRIHVDHRGAGDITVRMKTGTLTGSGSNSILAERRGSGAASIEVSGGSLTNDVFITTGNTATGDLSIGMSGGSLSGRLNINRNGGRGNGRITVSGDATIRQTQTEQFGVGVVSNGLGDELFIGMTGGSVEATGARSAGFFLRSTNNNAAAAAAMTAVIEGGSVRTRESGSSGVWFSGISGSRDASFRMTGGSIVTEADNSRGVYFALGRFGTGQTASVRMTGGSIVAEGLGSHGLSALAVDLGSVDAMTDAGATIATPFAVGMEGRLTQDASATGRLVFEHGGAVEARDVGVLAWARRSSGHTMGAGATTADDAARTMPMIHVTSSGDVTVGAPVTDAFIRARITGEDETLSTGEQAVLSAITAGDAAALTTALAALPDADYDADWKAEAEDLRRKRAASSAAPTGNGPLAQQAGEEILGLSRAGVRAYALSHTAIVDHVRAGNALSTEERAALDAVLTKGAGSELETALTALTGATYTTSWKNTVRRFAATYNAGDIQVDVTGGTIDAEGNGVEALYAVLHERNGAITVTVAEGARITGGANGVHVRGAGATGGVRNQRVTVNGRVRGGTGAGVYLVGGGTVTVGATGAVGATSGVGILGDGGGDLTATVSGTVTGDLRVDGGGDLTANVMAGGVVTGTIHDPVGPLTVAGSIGRLLYASGGTVTVARTGALTGVEVEGKTQALHSAAGALDVTVAGQVAGDLRAPSGGTLKLAVREGGKVPGTAHDPVGPLTVAGSIGRLLYTNGGTVTVAATGRLTGVEVEGKTQALHSAVGALDLTVSGQVAGDLRAPSGGTLKLAVREGGKVPGTVHDPVGPLTVAGSIGRLLYTSGGTVTVARTGALTGVEVEGKTQALHSAAGDLDVSVSGRVAGDLRAPSGGTLKLAVREGGTVTGTVHDPVGPLTVAGSIGRLLYTSGGTVTVAATGRLTGVEVEGKTQALHSAVGALDLTVSGQVTGDLRAPSGGTLKLAVREGGKVPGTVHDPVGPLTVAGSIGRLLYTSGGTVTVARTGALTGVEGETEALRSEAGDLDLSVAGRVTGDVRARGDGDLRATVAGTLTGDLIEEGDGDLSATVSGTVDGDVQAQGGGALRLDLKESGAVTGTVHDPAGPLTVAGRIGRLLYTNGATVTVARTGALTGVEVGGKTEALRSAAGDLALRVAGSVTGDIRAEGDGDLDATISGTLTGDVLGRGAGEHVVTVSKGGTVRGTIDLAASTVGVDGRAGRVRFDQGGTVTVGGTGWITGIEGVAIRNAAGELVVSVADGGRVTGDIIDLGARPARVTIGPGSRVEGSIDVAAAGSELRVGGTVTGGIDMAGAGSELRVDGTVEGRLRYRQGGMVTVGPDGKVEGGASSDRGKIVAVVERKPEETEDEARERAFPGFPDSVVEGVEEEGGGRRPTIKVEPEVVELAREHEPRMRVYEALPSVVLGMNGLRGYGERMAVPRSAKGGWARVERFQGKWKADASTSGKESGVGLRYRHQRHGVEVGLGGALGEEARIGASLHHRRGTAKVTEGGDVELYGTGAGVSGTWTREEDYLDVQAAMTWYEADLASSSRGVLKKDVSGLGHALGVEAGRRMELEGLPAGMVLTPRVGLVHSQVSMDGFSDVTGARVSVDDARSLRGRAGVEVETKPGGAAGSRVFGSVEVEHELSTDRKVRVSGMELESEAEATWLRLGLNGVHTWEEGRYTLAGGVGYATSGDSHELGGGVSLNLRF